MKTSSSLFVKDQFETCLTRLLPASSGLQLQKVELSEGELWLEIKATAAERSCPVCGVRSTRVQSHYQRTLQDLPWIDLRVRLRLHVRRFFCANPSCSRHIFSERLPNFAQAYARRTDRLCQALLDMGWALGGEPGSRLCDKQTRSVAASTLLGLLRRAGRQEWPTPRVLGVDDWAFQRQHPSGTILVESCAASSGRPLDGQR